MEMSHFQCKKPTLGGSSHLYTWTFQRVPNGFKGCQLTIPLGLFGTPWKVLVGSNYLVSPIYKPFGSFGTGTYDHHTLQTTYVRPGMIRQAPPKKSDTENGDMTSSKSFHNGTRLTPFFCCFLLQPQAILVHHKVR